MSQCIAEALVLNIKVRDTELEQFCRRELEGSKFTFNIDPETISHRLVLGYWSLGEVANAPYFPDTNTLFATLASSEYFRRAWQPFLEPISQIEHKRDGAHPNAFLMIKQRPGDMNPNTETPDVPVFWYGPGDAHAQIVEATRTALTKKLLSLSPQRDRIKGNNSYPLADADAAPSEVNQNINLRQLSAGGNITVIQQNVTLYLPTTGETIQATHISGEDISKLLNRFENNFAAPRIGKEDIFTLLTKLHNDITPLSHCIAEAFSFASKLHNKSLIEFCLREIEGWDMGAVKIQVGDDYPKYRIIRGYISYKQIHLNKEAFLWWKNIDNLFNFMEREEDFYDIDMFEPEPIANIEGVIKNVAGEPAIGVSTTKLGDWIKDTAKPNWPMYQYFQIREYEKVVQAVRGELTKRLLKQVGEIES